MKNDENALIKKNTKPSQFAELVIITNSINRKFLFLQSFIRNTKETYLFAGLKKALPLLAVVDLSLNPIAKEIQNISESFIDLKSVTVLC